MVMGTSVLLMGTDIKAALKMDIDQDSVRWNIRTYLVMNELDLVALREFKLKKMRRTMQRIPVIGKMINDMAKERWRGLMDPDLKVNGALINDIKVQCIW